MIDVSALLTKLSVVGMYLNPQTPLGIASEQMEVIHISLQFKWIDL